MAFHVWMIMYAQMIKVETSDVVKSAACLYKMATYILMMISQNKLTIMKGN